ncbi:helix-turn-helix transcriptional regulator [Luteibacter jiangsuensis]|uniref:Helix-turn-helix transcriptional regulator n=1 Tax=Luteibacter jiangsuensis TaxID=637577 RepID=A0ABX0Q9P5_9GAMM|nr:helix-turn-helix transcriptional regulator [Luteibacter jiangsuensis]NID05893.1 helix-turn-helix transcriptional regulator [Luteibacter jiangsuensis]
MRDVLSAQRLALTLADSRAQVAEALDRPQTYVSDIEKNRRGVDMLQVMEFCDVFEVPFDEFAKETIKRIRKAKA